MPGLINLTQAVECVKVTELMYHCEAFWDINIITVVFLDGILATGILQELADTVCCDKALTLSSPVG